MADNPPIQDTVKRLVTLLVRRRFAEVLTLTNHRGLTEEELQTAIDEFPQQLVDPDDQAYEALDITKVSERDEYHVAFDLWTREAGKSDLTLELRFTRNRSDWDCEIEGIHVL